MLLVSWVDSYTETKSGQPWYDRAEIVENLEDAAWPDLIICNTIGFLVFENEHVVTLTMSDGQDQIGPYISIPKVSIISRKEVGECPQSRSGSP